MSAAPREGHRVDFVDFWPPLKSSLAYKLDGGTFTTSPSWPSIATICPNHAPNTMHHKNVQPIKPHGKLGVFPMPCERLDLSELGGG